MMQQMLDNCICIDKRLTEFSNFQSYLKFEKNSQTHSFTEIGGLSLKAWFPYDRNSRRRFGDVSPISRRHMETITAMIIWKPRFKPGFHMIVTVGDASATCPRSVGDIWKRSLL